jgi:hypothetical protein
MPKLGAIVLGSLIIPGLLLAADATDDDGNSGFQISSSGDCYDECMSAFGWQFTSDGVPYRYSYCTGPTGGVITCWYNRVN